MLLTSEEGLFFLEVGLVGLLFGEDAGVDFGEAGEVGC